MQKNRIELAKMQAQQAPKKRAKNQKIVKNKIEICAQDHPAMCVLS